MSDTEIPMHARPSVLWTRLHVNFYLDVKFMKINPALKSDAFLVLQMATAWSRQPEHMTDGVIDIDVLRNVIGIVPIDLDTVLAELARVGYVALDGDTITLLTYADWNDTKAKAVSRSATAAANGSKGGKAKAANAAARTAPPTPVASTEDGTTAGRVLVRTALATTGTRDKYTDETLALLANTVDSRLAMDGAPAQPLFLAAVETTLDKWKGSGSIAAYFSKALSGKVDDAAKNAPAAPATLPPGVTMAPVRSARGA